MSGLENTPGHAPKSGLLVMIVGSLSSLSHAISYRSDCISSESGLRPKSSRITGCAEERGAIVSHAGICAGGAG